MGPISLFSIATLIWGSTWLAITFQLGSVAAEASVVYRFALAALMLAAWCLATGRSLRFPAAQHAWLASQGALLFGLNYLCVYWAEQHIASGLVAVLFSLIVFLNLVGVRMFFATPVNRRTALGAALGVAGVTLLFWRELAGMQTDALRGILFGLAATVFASGGNLLAVRNQRRGIPLLPGVAWGMTYGTLTIVIVAALNDIVWTFDPRPGYLLSLLYLAAFGSVIAFAAYLTLLGKIGAARAGYVGVAVPVVALLLSTVFEHYEWTLPALAGAALCIAGNVLVLMPQPTTVRV
ncbi:MAG: EamA family transporter [Betaproteobacteria bacterium]|nr:MAG: EamA family transporter [Betaproteobacteria bacterium]